MPSISPGDRQRVLLRSPLFQAFRPDELARLAERLVERRFGDGQTIFLRGDPGSSLMAVTAGRVRISVSSSEGREVLLAVVGPGDVFGEMSVLDGGPRSADATAACDCRVLTLDRRDLQPLLHRSPDAALRLCQLLCERIRSATEKLEGLATLPVAARLARLLLMQSEQHGPRVAVGLSQSDLGRLIGASRQKVNMHLGRWAADGLVDRHPGSLRIRDHGGLAEIAASGRA